MSAGLYFRHQACLEHDPRVHSPAHPDTPERLEALERHLAGLGWLGWELREAPAASEGELELVHSAGHVQGIRELCEAGGGEIDADTFVGEASYRAALHAAGGVCTLVRALLGGEAGVGFCGVRPAGHHAERARAMGFCLFDNVAVAAELAIRELGVERVFILDWDVHHGNGTAEIFRRRGDVLFASIHQGGLYPGTGPLGDVGSGEGEGYTINLPVPAGSEGDLWCSLLEHVVLPAAVAFEPQLVMVSAGFDAHVGDPLAECRLETEAFAEMARHVREAAKRLGAPVGAVLEGGYQPVLLGECVQATMAALGGEGEPAETAPDPLLTARAAAQIGHYWPL
ncbi:MAG TPA: histone deacetylase [Solirubrobacteraceae bacterium]|jgi:acetoin utilization deacetylase AcuC-like enzyme|nr:histone deacetylase [Solirubrobacteraceae bacterium]